jgi:hypothetical protein
MDNIAYLQGYGLIPRLEFFKVDPAVFFPTGDEGFNP